MIAIFAHTYLSGVQWLANAPDAATAQAQIDAGDFDSPDNAWIIAVPCAAFRDYDGERAHTDD